MRLFVGLTPLPYQPSLDFIGIPNLPLIDGWCGKGLQLVTNKGKLTINP